MIIFIHGADTYSSRQYLATVINQFKQKHDPDGRAISFFTEESGSWDDLARELTASDLFVAKRLIVAKDVLGRKDIFDGLGDFLDNLSLGDGIALVVYQSGAVDKRLRLIKKLLAEKSGKEFDLPKPFAVAQFIKERAASGGKKIEPQAVALLSEIVGADLWRAQAEVDKLVCRPREVISLSDIKQTTASSSDDEIWPLLDAVAGGKKNQALQLLERQLTAGAEPAYLLSMVVRQVRLLLAVHNAPESESALAAGLSMHPYAIKKAREHADNFTAAKLKLMYQALLRLDAALKSGRGEPAVLFTVLLDSIIR